MQIHRPDGQQRADKIEHLATHVRRRVHQQQDPKDLQKILELKLSGHDAQPPQELCKSKMARDKEWWVERTHAHTHARTHARTNNVLQ